jgi:outer membrane protein OmpA-like peptidoglycan-associated protein
MKKLHLLPVLLLTTLSGLAQGLQPTNNLALLKGKVTNFKNKALSNELVLLVNDVTKASFKIATDVNGKFELLVPITATYSLKYKNFTKEMDYTKMIIPSDKEATYEVQIKIDPPKEFVLDNVYFDTGKSTLKPNSNKTLNDLVEVLKLKSTMVIEIQGHTDNVGDEEANVKLSQARAETVMKYLVNKGIEATRITAKGFGASKPVADNAAEEGRAKNRRTSLKVIKD